MSISEAVLLLMAVLLTPIILSLASRIRVCAGRPFFIGGYLAMVASYVFTIAEGYWLPDAFNLAEHAAYAVSGVLFALAARTTRAAVLRSGLVR